MARAARALIHLDAIRANHAYAKKLASSSRVCAVIKADAYGHGAAVVARALDAEVDAFGLACIEEARELRAARVESPILLLEGFFEAREIEEIARLNLATVVHSHHQVAMLERSRPNRPIDVWLKIDTGMHRLGLQPDEAAAAYQTLSSAPQVGRLGLMSHFARADEADNAYTREQMRRFAKIVKGIRVPVSLANSAGILAWPESHADWVRPGIMLYGWSPLEDDQVHRHALRAAMTLKSEIIAVHRHREGEPIGYGGRFRCEGDMRIGVVAMGYGDGYPRHAKDGTPVLVAGRRTQIVGRVSMDMLTVDLTDMPDVSVGAPVELWGESLSANEVAECCDTIAYQLITGITRRVSRVYRESVDGYFARAAVRERFGAPATRAPRGLRRQAL